MNTKIIAMLGIMIVVVIGVTILPVAQAVSNISVTHHFTQSCWTGNQQFSGTITGVSQYVNSDLDTFYDTIFTVDYPQTLSHCYLNVNAPELYKVILSVTHPLNTPCELVFTQFDTVKTCKSMIMVRSHPFNLIGVAEYGVGDLLPLQKYPFNIVTTILP